MRKQSIKQGKLPKLPVLLGTLMMLAGCVTDGQGTGSGTLTVSTDSSAACVTMSPIKPSRGKPGGPSTEDIASALDRDHPIDRVRNLVGDTSSTLTQVDKNNAAWGSICGGSGGAK